MTEAHPEVTLNATVSGGPSALGESVIVRVRFANEGEHPIRFPRAVGEDFSDSFYLESDAEDLPGAEPGLKSGPTKVKAVSFPQGDEFYTAVPPGGHYEFDTDLSSYFSAPGVYTFRIVYNAISDWTLLRLSDPPEYLTQRQWRSNEVEVTITGDTVRRVAPGLDLFETRPEGTYQDFSRTPIPGFFFSLWSFPFRFRGRVHFAGIPIAREVLGSTDTVVVRRQAAELPGPSTVPIELVALSISSVEPIQVRRLWLRREEWDVRVDVSAAQHSTGEMTITETGAGGGEFSSVLTVNPRFTFIRRRDGKIRTLDGRGSVEFRVESAKWSADASGLTPPIPQPGLSPGFVAGVDPVAGRIPVDHLPADFPVSAHSVITAAL